jgi:hypothetical protein
MSEEGTERKVIFFNATFNRLLINLEYLNICFTCPNSLIENARSDEGNDRCKAV